MKSYIVSCTASNGELRSRHVEAKNHVAAIKQVEAEGFTVVSIDRDDDEARPRSRKRWKRLIVSIVVCIVLAVLCVTVAWFRMRRFA